MQALLFGYPELPINPFWASSLEIGKSIGPGRSKIQEMSYLSLIQLPKLYSGPRFPLVSSIKRQDSTEVGNSLDMLKF